MRRSPKPGEIFGAGAKAPAAQRGPNVIWMNNTSRELELLQLIRDLLQTLHAHRLLALVANRVTPAMDFGAKMLLGHRAFSSFTLLAKRRPLIRKGARAKGLALGHSEAMRPWVCTRCAEMRLYRYRTVLYCTVPVSAGSLCKTVNPF